MRKRSWTKEQLEVAIRTSFSFRQVLSKLSLKEAGGNYDQLKRYIREYQFNTNHFRGRGWNLGMKIPTAARVPLSEILVKGNYFQSFKLKNRLFKEGLKLPACEECGWAKRAESGHLPLELDHINGDRHDNRLENLRVLCPNCHSLKPTHRGRNIKIKKPPGWRNR